MLQLKLMELTALSLILLILPSSVSATNWYVDNQATGGNTGTSWANAWNSFASIVWGSTGVKAGDTLYISGGSTSKTYNADLIIGASGSAGLPITITIGKEAGHNGTVIIDRGNATGSSGIYMANKHHIHITGRYSSTTEKRIRVSGTYFSGISIYGSSYAIELDYLDITQTAQLVDGTYGVLIDVSYDQSNPLGSMHDCTIHDIAKNIAIRISSTNDLSPTNFGWFEFYNNDMYDIEADYIYLVSSGVTIRDNKLRDKKRWISSGFHTDGIHGGGSYVKIYNNQFSGFVLSPDDEHLNAYIRYTPNDFQDFLTIQKVYIFNNIFTDTNPPSSGDGFRAIEMGFGGGDPGRQDATSVSDIYISNNAFVGIPFLPVGFGFKGRTGNLGTAAVSNIFFVNNILKNLPNSNALGGSGHQVMVSMDTGDGTVTYGSYGDSVDVVVDYNLAYASSTPPYGTKWKVDTTEYTYTTFRTTFGCQDNAPLNPIDPLLNSDYTIPSSSPAKDAGISLANIFTTDKNGISRPQGSSWDIGAYEYSGTIYYVDYATGAQNNTGTSTATPWKYCPGDSRWTCTGACSFTSLSAGDRVIFKGGVNYSATAGQVYMITLSWGGSGDADTNRIIYDGDSGTYAARWGTGTAKAILDGAGIAYVLMHPTSSRNYITINSLELKNNNVSASGDALIDASDTSSANYIKITNCYLHDAGIYTDKNHNNGAGIASQSSYWTIDGNTFTNTSGKGIYFLNVASHNTVRNNVINDVVAWGIGHGIGSAVTATDNSYYNNTFHNIFKFWAENPSYPWPYHGDVIMHFVQGAAGSFQNISIYNNYVYADVGADTSATSVFTFQLNTAGSSLSNIRIYNNVVANMNANWFSAVSVSAGGSLDGLYIYDNTLWTTLSSVAGDGFVFVLDSASPSINNVKIKNNAYVGTYLAVNLGDYTSSWTNTEIDYNSYYTYYGTYNDPFYANGGRKTWSQWQGLGWDINGYGPHSNPLFTDISTAPFNLSPQVGSPLINKGVDLGSSYNTDYLGISRPQGSAWDIGAYEYAPSGCIHKSDTNCDGCVDMTELSAFISRWNINNLDVTMKELMEAIGLWNMGCP